MKTILIFVLLFVSATLLSGCKKKTPQAANSDPAPTAAANSAAAAEDAAITAPTSAPVSAPTIDSARAMKYVREIVGLGPRYVGTAAHAKTESSIEARLRAAGAEVAQDSFSAKTPAGSLAMRNIIGKFPGKKDGIIVIASHYDTLYNRKDFVGANDAGSSSGLLLELANELNKQKPGNGYSVWLVFFDGEEAIKNWGPEDSDYGSTHLANAWQQDGTLKKIKALLLTDMIGDSDLNIERDTSSTPWLEDLVGAAAKNVGYQSFFFARAGGIDDDHRPFMQRGVPCADLIDFDYGYNNVFWHTPQDTLDKLSPHSLQVVGDVVLEAVAMLDERQL